MCEITITKFKAKIVNDFADVMREFWKNDGDIDYSTIENDIDNSFSNLVKRITGQEVTIEKWENTDYPPSDYFESIDQNYPLPTNAFVRL